MQFFAKYHTNRFHILQLLFRISGSSEKENKLRPKTSTGEFISSNEISFQGKGGPLVSKAKAKLLPHKFYDVFRSKGATVEELKKSYEEHEEQPKP